MSRPPSILLFERLYLASLLLTVIATAAFWSSTRELMLAMPQVQSSQSAASMVPAIMAGTLVVTVLASLLIWWLTARARSVAGKWLAVATEAIGLVYAVLLLLRLAQGNAANVTQSLLNLAAAVLAIAATVMLFRTDARTWFAQDDLSEGAASA